MSIYREAATQSAKRGPFEEARGILKRFGKKYARERIRLFETGYGPSGLPHIGTFGEVARTSMVRNALYKLSDIPTPFIRFFRRHGWASQSP